MQIVSTSLRAVLGVFAMIWPVMWPAMRAASAQETPSAQQIWTVPEIGALPNKGYGRLVRRGRDLITATYAYIGPEVACRAKRFAGNNLACGDCHLEAGTKKFGMPLFGLFGEFPRYSARSGGANHHRGSTEFLHDPQHERPGNARQRAGNAGHGGLHQIFVHRRAA